MLREAEVPVELGEKYEFPPRVTLAMTVTMIPTDLPHLEPSS